jgi:hypothetical protein
LPATQQLGFPRGGFDTAQELWKESISFPAYSTTGLTLPDLVKPMNQRLVILLF